MDTKKLRQTIARIDPAGDDAVDALLEVADLLDALSQPAEAQAEPEEDDERREAGPDSFLALVLENNARLRGEVQHLWVASMASRSKLLRYATVEAELDAHMARADGLSEQLAQVEHQRDTAQALKEGLEHDMDTALAEVARKARREALEEAALSLEEAAQKGEAGGGWRRGICDSAEWVRALADEPEQAEKEAAREGKEE